MLVASWLQIAILLLYELFPMFNTEQNDLDHLYLFLLYQLYDLFEQLFNKVFHEWINSLNNSIIFCLSFSIVFILKLDLFMLKLPQLLNFQPLLICSLVPLHIVFRMCSSSDQTITSLILCHLLLFIHLRLLVIE